MGHRTIVFDVGGEIHLTSPIHVLGSFLTIDGLTAPAPGITLVGDGLILRGNVGLPSNQFPVNDVIVRGLRIRGAPFDGIQIAFGAHHIVIDHVSVRDTGDGLIDITEGAHDVTVSWSILAGGSKAMLVKYNAYNVTLHHNLWVDTRNRNPNVAVDDVGTPASRSPPMSGTTSCGTGRTAWARRSTMAPGRTSSTTFIRRRPAPGPTRRKR